VANRSRVERYPQLIKAIAATVGEGCYPIAAARKLGVPRSTFERWLDCGYSVLQEHDAETGDQLRELWEADLIDDHARRCAELALAIEEALGMTEVDASSRVYLKEPKAWLEQGPARERWRKESRVEIDGTMDHTGSIEIQCPAPIPVLAAGMAELEAIGLDVRHDRNLFRQLPAPSSGNGEPELDGNGHS